MERAEVTHQRKILHVHVCIHKMCEICAGDLKLMYK
jgi:hypothetical protein